MGSGCGKVGKSKSFILNKSGMVCDRKWGLEWFLKLFGKLNTDLGPI